MVASNRLLPDRTRIVTERAHQFIPSVLSIGRRPDLESGGCEFKSHHSDHLKGRLIKIIG